MRPVVGEGTPLVDDDGVGCVGWVVLAVVVAVVLAATGAVLLRLVAH